jgi:hypothetical protein
MLDHKDQDLAERRLEKLISRLPRGLAGFIHWARKPKMIWLRVPLGILLFFGGFLAILPIFGLWMTPLGLILLAQDFPPVRRGVYRMVNWTAAKRPRWFGEQPRYS